jgi:uncharacterized membrane protein
MTRAPSDEGAESPKAFSRLAAVWRAVFVVLSPVVLYVAVTRLSVQKGAMLVVGWIALRTLPILYTSPRQHLRAALRLPAVAVAFAILGGVTDDRRLFLLMPSATQLGFAWTFGSTLRGEGKMPLVEHFARLQKKELTPEEVTYCRSVTWVWATAMVVSAVVGLVLAWFASPEVWTAFTGVGAYALIAGLFGIEYVFRSVRFRKLRSSWAERIFDRLLSSNQSGR